MISDVKQLFMYLLLFVYLWENVYSGFFLHFKILLMVLLFLIQFFDRFQYGCKSWTVKKAEHWRIDAFELWCWRRLLRVPWTARRSNQSILKEISPECALEGLILKLKLQYLAIWFEELTHFKRLWCWEWLRVEGEGDSRGWDGWMASLTQWTWVWVSSRCWWWTGRPGLLQSMGSQRVGHDWATELNWVALDAQYVCFVLLCCGLAGSSPDGLSFWWLSILQFSSFLGGVRCSLVGRVCKLSIVPLSQWLPVFRGLGVPGPGWWMESDALALFWIVRRHKEPPCPQDQSGPHWKALLEDVFKNNFLYLLYFRLCWVFIAFRAFLQLWRARAAFSAVACLGCRVQAGRHVGFSRCGSRALEHRLGSWGAWA